MSPVCLRVLRPVRYPARLHDEGYLQGRARGLCDPRDSGAVHPLRTLDPDAARRKRSGRPRARRQALRGVRHAGGPAGVDRAAFVGSGGERRHAGAGGMTANLSAERPAATAAERKRRMLITALGADVASAMRDPQVAEIMVNPDGALRLDRLGEGRIDTEIRIESQQVERIIRLVASRSEENTSELQALMRNS